MSDEPLVAEAERAMNAPRLTPLTAIRLTLEAAMHALAERALRWATLLLAFALYAVVSWQPGPWTLGAAVAFTLLVLPCWWRKDGG